jgi:hypothetical protein
MKVLVCGFYSHSTLISVETFRKLGWAGEWAPILFVMTDNILRQRTPYSSENKVKKGVKIINLWIYKF